ncbi:MAG: phage portal protein [Clostridia bacterium]|nr:phage portal protein [Clostridia bacterium]
MNYSAILRCLREYFGADVSDDGMAALIEKWREWYSGSSEGFHRILLNNGLSTVSRQMFTLHMAKRVCEDWANLLLNEKTYIVLSDKNASDFINGPNGVFEKNDYRTQLNRLVEKAFALGSAAVICCIEGAVTDRSGNVVKTENASVRFDYADAESIFPVSWSGDTVSEAAFVRRVVENGETLVYIQAHLLENGEYVIYNRCFSEKDGLREEPLPDEIAPALKTGSDIPWFSIIKPNTVNSLVPSSPMGISVFADAIDVIKGIDLCYDSLNMEFVLGKKMVFLRRDLLEKDEDGNYYAPQDTNRQLFMYLGDKAIDGDMLPQEFNPLLRVEDHVKCIQEQMNYLSSKCGFGERYYRFDSSRTVTATQINSENSTLYRCIKKHEILLEKAIVNTVRAALHIGEKFLGKVFDKNSGIKVIFDDSVIEDKAAMQSRDLELVKSKIMAPFEFRMKYFGEDEETAKRILSEAHYG